MPSNKDYAVDNDSTVAMDAEIDDLSIQRTTIRANILIYKSKLERRS